MDNNDSETSFSGILEGLTAFYASLKKVTAEIDAAMPKIVSTLEAVGKMAIWFRVVGKLAEKQIVFTDDLTADLACEWEDKEDISIAVEDYYYTLGHIRQLIDRIGKDRAIESHYMFYSEIVECSKRQHYQLACIGMFALLDGVLSDLTDMVSTNYNKRINKIKETVRKNEELTVLDRKLLCVYKGIRAASNSMFCGVDFKGSETKLLNRNWLQHGRTHRTYNRMDFLKALLFLDGILFFAEQGNTTKIQIEEDET